MFLNFLTNFCFLNISDVNNVIYDNNDVQLPSFLSNVENQTVIAGRTAVLKCSVKNLGNYKVLTNLCHLGVGGIENE